MPVHQGTSAARPFFVTVQEFVGAGKYKIRLMERTKGRRQFDIREYASRGSFIGFTRRGVAIESHEDLLKLKAAIDMTVGGGWMKPGESGPVSPAPAGPARTAAADGSSSLAESPAEIRPPARGAEVWVATRETHEIADIAVCASEGEAISAARGWIVESLESYDPEVPERVLARVRKLLAAGNVREAHKVWQEDQDKYPHPVRVRWVKRTVL